MSRKRVFAGVALLVLALAHWAAAGQIGYWAFDEGSGTTAKDGSGNGNNGRLVGGPVWVDGVLGKALDFDGVDDYVEVPHSTDLIPTTGKATVAVWINAKRHTGPGGSQWQGILAKGGAPRLYNLYTEASQVLHFSTGPSGAYIGPLSTGTVPLNEWVHVAVAVDGMDFFYINGQPAGVGGQGATVPTGGTAPLTIGQTGESNFFLGMIDEVRLYDLALTPEEVKALYEGNPPRWPKARAPSPADEAIGITLALFTWESGDGAILHDVYLGTSPELTEANQVVVRYPGNVYYHTPGLESGVTYYWRVDEIEADMVTVNTGDVWSFTAAPVEAYLPSPADGATQVARDSNLSWSPASGAVSHNVYFGTSRDDVAAGTGDTFKGNQFATVFEPGDLEGDTVYHWRVDEIDVSDKVITGNVWSFRTRPLIPISDPNLVGRWKLDEATGTFVLDSSGYENHGEFRGNPQWVPGYDGGAVELDGVDDYIEVPHNETLTMDTEVSVMAWIHTSRHTGPGGAEWQGILAKGNSPRSYSFYTYAPGTLHFSAAGGGGTSSGTVPLNEWVHVAVAAGPSAHTYFINGESAGQGGAATPPGAQDTAPVRIGTTQEGQRAFLGMIDDARIYNVALTEEQIKEAMRGDPLLARDPIPSAGATVDVRRAASLSWMAGDMAAEHDVYFGTDVAAVSDADASSAEYMGRQTDTSYSLAGLVEFGGGTYVWRIDEVEADGVTIHKGRTWVFTVADYLIVDDFESYTDNIDDEETIWQTWVDGLTNGTGSVVGYFAAPFAERTIVHSGLQSMPFDYNNFAAPFYSEAELELSPVENWTVEGVTDLTLWVHGFPQRFAETTPGVYRMGANSDDVWGTSDNFTFAYKRLNGDGTIVAKIHSVDNTSAWAKAGVMLRESLDPASSYAFMFATPDGRRAFQNRPGTAASAVSAHSATGAVTLPHWVKLERKGNLFTAYHSSDGTNWIQQPDNENTGTDASANPQTIFMTGSVYIGLALTSNNARAGAGFAEFSDVQTTGSVGGAWRAVSVGPNTGNDRDDLYVAVQDSSNKLAVVTNPDPDAVLATDWTEWKIPLSDFAPVNMTRVKKLYVGVGDRDDPTQDGTGLLFIDDIRVVRPAPAVE